MLPEPKDGPVRLTDSSSGATLSVRRLAARVLVDGPLAETSLEVTFTNELGRAVEGDLILSMPPSAALLELTVVCGERTLRGQVRSRERALVEYQRALDAGQSAALGETEGEDLVRLRVSPIDAGAEVSVTFGVLHALTPTSDGHRLVLPLTYMPRYVEAAAPTNALEAAALERPRPLTLAARANVVVEVLHGERAPTVLCASHASRAETERHGAAYRTTVTVSDVSLDRDLLLDVLDRTAGTVVWARHDPGAGPDGLGPTTTVAVVPPAFADEGTTTPRVVTFLVDRSGSMGGAPMESAIRAVRGALRGLESQDRFNIVAFDTELEALAPAPVPFDDAALKGADAFIANVTARGGTDASMALRAALDQRGSLREVATVLSAPPPDAKHRLHLVVFMTDGDVADAEHVLTSAQGRQRLIDTRLHVLGIGDSVNHSMLAALAKVGSGTYTPVATNEDLERALARLKGAMSAPLWTSVKVSLDVDGEVRAPKHLEPAGALDLFAGQPLLLAFRGEVPQGARLVLRGQTHDGEELRVVTPLDAALSDTRESSRRLASKAWALLRNVRLTYRFDEADDPALEALGTTFGLANRAVALIGVHDEVRGERARDVVPVVLPLPRNLAHEEPSPVTMQLRTMAGSAPRPKRAAPPSPATPPPMARAMAYSPPPPPTGAPPPPRATSRPAPYMSLPTPPMMAAVAVPSGLGSGAGSVSPPEAPALELDALTDDDAGLRLVMLLQGASGLFDGGLAVTLAVVAGAVVHGHTAREGAFRAELRRTAAWLRVFLSTPATDALAQADLVRAALALSLLTVVHGEATHPLLDAECARLLAGLSLSDRPELRARVAAAVARVEPAPTNDRAARIRAVFLRA